MKVLRTRVNELEVINDLFRSRVTELEASEAVAVEAARRAEVSVRECERRERLLKECLEEMKGREVSMCERIGKLERERCERCERSNLKEEEKEEEEEEKKKKQKKEEDGWKQECEGSSIFPMPPPMQKSEVGGGEMKGEGSIASSSAGGAVGGLQLPHLRETLQTPGFIDGGVLSHLVRQRHQHHQHHQ
ncbi:hypothetical protein KEM54_004670, partial [Ascosphaera aggregata]